MALTNIKKLEQRSQYHWEAALELAEYTNEWSAVMAFYSCYHLARASLLSDPVFEDEVTLRELVHPDMRSDDKYVEKHKVRTAGGSNGFGINDLVQSLYKHVARNYRALHTGSIMVRYQMGLQAPYTIESLLEQAQGFRHEYQLNHIVYSKSKDLKPINPKKS